MDISLLYFSPTGNCEMLCGEICHFMQNNKCTFINITNPSNRILLLSKPITCDLLILILPVYAHSIPKIVTAFFKKAKVQCKAASVICTYGHVSPGNAVTHTIQLLAQKGIPTISAAEIPMSHSYSSLLKNVPCEMQNIDWLDKFIHCTLENLKNKHFIQVPQKLAIGSFFPQRFLAQMAVKLPVANDHCNACGKCHKVCPTGAIDESNYIHSKLCIRCGACIKHCPQYARILKFTCPIPRWYIAFHMRKPKNPRTYL